MYAILDIEGIQVTHEHICTRKLYILDCCGNDHEEEFVACRDFEQLEEKFKISFEYCWRKVHQLPYYPRRLSMPCHSSRSIVRNFAERNEITVILYKGGTIEKRLCQDIGVHSYDIGKIVPKVKTHDPREEVHLHMENIVLEHLEEINTIVNSF